MPGRLQNFIAGKRTASVLGKHVDANAASEDALAALAVIRPIEFAWLWIRDADRFGAGVELAAHHNAFVDALFPPVLSCWFGTFPHLTSPPDARIRFVAEAQRRFGSRAKVRHGIADACITNVGSATRFALIVSSESRGDILTGLSAQPFGSFQLHGQGG
jgi:hypothetical protein